jgi:glutamine phosphoribosylpyrophosphate amidotransferase
VEVDAAGDDADDTPKEACGVFGIYAPGHPVAQLTYLGLYALQHRGQESAGMAVSDGDTMTVVKDMGLVSHVFDSRTLAPLQGHLAVGHVRYSTTGASTWGNAQPIYRETGDAGFVLGHNGNLTNTAELTAAAGTRSMRPFDEDRIDPKLCLFEFVYFARPDSRLYGQTVHTARQRMGELLAEQAPLPADTHSPPREAMVMPVPESGIPAAEGYARRSGIPFGQGLVRNRYIGRTFIAPGQDQRSQGVRMKFNPIRENIAGKRLVVIDDSIVRGTSTRAVVAMLRESGAAEIHLRISSPPYRWPCYFGMDTGTRGELVAADLTISEVRDYLGCDTLAYLELDRLLAATAVPGRGFCTACLTGDYPVTVPMPRTADELPSVDLVHPSG